ncbi:hypothetical protein C8R44DRAFT_201215 [Mycena epipterygia]|nr:hypothetical protein C8R44DRAFT_201215 [Mycena epipterygia]
MGGFKYEDGAALWEALFGEAEADADTRDRVDEGNMDVDVDAATEGETETEADREGGRPRKRRRVSGGGLGEAVERALEGEVGGGKKAKEEDGEVMKEEEGEVKEEAVDGEVNEEVVEKEKLEGKEVKDKEMKEEETSAKQRDVVLEAPGALYVLSRVGEGKDKGKGARWDVVRLDEEGKEKHTLLYRALGPDAVEVGVGGVRFRGTAVVDGEGDVKVDGDEEDGKPVAAEAEWGPRVGLARWRYASCG